MSKTYKEIVASKKDATTLQKELLQSDYKKYITEQEGIILKKEIAIENTILGKIDNSVRPIYIGSANNSIETILLCRKCILNSQQNIVKAQALYKELFPEA